MLGGSVASGDHAPDAIRRGRSCRSDRRRTACRPAPNARPHATPRSRAPRRRACRRASRGTPCRRTGSTRSRPPSRSKASDVGVDDAARNGSSRRRGVDAEDRDRHLLAARAAVGHDTASPSRSNAGLSTWCTPVAIGASPPRRSACPSARRPPHGLTPAGDVGRHEDADAIRRAASTHLRGRPRRCAPRAACGVRATGSAQSPRSIARRAPATAQAGSTAGMKRAIMGVGARVNGRVAATTTRRRARRSSRGSRASSRARCAARS